LPKLDKIVGQIEIILTEVYCNCMPTRPFKSIQLHIFMKPWLGYFYGTEVFDNKFLVRM